MSASYDINFSAPLHSISGNVSKGTALIQGTGGIYYLPATAANMAAQGNTVVGGVALIDGSPSAPIAIQQGGIIPASVSGLGVGAKSPVIADPTTARLARLSSPTASDAVVGYCNEFGDTTLSLGLINAVTSTGGGATTLTLDATSAALSAGDAYCAKPGATSVVKATPAAVVAAGGSLLGLASSTVLSGATFVPADTVTNAATALGAVATPGLPVGVNSSARPYRLTQWNGLQSIVGFANADGSVQIYPINAPQATALADLNPRAFGATPNNTTLSVMQANDVAFAAMITALGSQTGGNQFTRRICIDDNYHLTQPWDVRQFAYIYGNSGSLSAGSATLTWHFQSNTLLPGIILRNGLTVAEGGGADQSVVEHLNLVAMSPLPATVAWAPNTAYTLGQLVAYTTDYGAVRYRVTVAGTSGGTAPTAFTVTAVGGTITDGGVTYVVESGTFAKRWYPGMQVYLGDYLKADDDNRYLAHVTTAGTTGTARPLYSSYLLGNTVKDGTAVVTIESSNAILVLAPCLIHNIGTSGWPNFAVHLEGSAFHPRYTQTSADNSHVEFIKDQGSGGVLLTRGSDANGVIAGHLDAHALGYGNGHSGYGSAVWHDASLGPNSMVGAYGQNGTGLGYKSTGTNNGSVLINPGSEESKAYAPLTGATVAIGGHQVVNTDLNVRVVQSGNDRGITTVDPWGLDTTTCFVDGRNIGAPWAFGFKPEFEANTWALKYDVTTGSVWYGQNATRDHLYGWRTARATQTIGGSRFPAGTSDFAIGRGFFAGDALRRFFAYDEQKQNDRTINGGWRAWGDVFWLNAQPVAGQHLAQATTFQGWSTGAYVPSTQCVTTSYVGTQVVSTKFVAVSGFVYACTKPGVGCDAPTFAGLVLPTTVGQEAVSWTAGTKVCDLDQYRATTAHANGRYYRPYAQNWRRFMSAYPKRLYQPSSSSGQFVRFYYQKFIAFTNFPVGYLMQSTSGGYLYETVKAGETGYEPVTKWTAGATYVMGQRICATTNNGKAFVVTAVSGVTAGAQPAAFPTAVNGQVVVESNGNVTYSCTDNGGPEWPLVPFQEIAMPLLSSVGEKLVTRLCHPDPGQPIQRYKSGTTYTLGDCVRPIGNGNLAYTYTLESITTAGATSYVAGAEPTWPANIVTTVTQGVGVWRLANVVTLGQQPLSSAIGYSPTNDPWWEPAKAYALNDIVRPFGYVGSDKLMHRFRCTTAGTSGAAIANEPAWPGSGTVADNTVIWTLESAGTTSTLEPAWDLRDACYTFESAVLQWVQCEAITGAAEPTWGATVTGQLVTEAAVTTNSRGQSIVSQGAPDGIQLQWQDAGASANASVIAVGAAEFTCISATTPTWAGTGRLRQRGTTSIGVSGTTTIGCDALAFEGVKLTGSGGILQLSTATLAYTDADAALAFNGMDWSLANSTTGWVTVQIQAGTGNKVYLPPGASARIWTDTTGVYGGSVEGLQTGRLTTTAVTANQVIGTVTLQDNATNVVRVELGADQAASTNGGGAEAICNVIMRAGAATIAGAPVFVNATWSAGLGAPALSFNASGAVLQVRVTPANTTSTVWAYRARVLGVV